MQNGMRPDTEPYPAYRDFSGESRAALMAEIFEAIAGLMYSTEELS
jgi:hypothetical protein